MKNSCAGIVNLIGNQYNYTKPILLQFVQYQQKFSCCPISDNIYADTDISNIGQPVYWSALVYFVGNILNHIKLQWAIPLLQLGLLLWLLLILILTSPVSSASFSAVGGLWVFKWWSPTHHSGLCATTQRNTRSSPVALTERCVLVLFILLGLSAAECILRQSKLAGFLS